MKHTLENPDIGHHEDGKTEDAPCYALTNFDRVLRSGYRVEFHRVTEGGGGNGGRGRG